MSPISNVNSASSADQPRVYKKTNAKVQGIQAADNDIINSLSNPNAAGDPVKFAEPDANSEEYMAALRGYSAEFLYYEDTTYGDGDGTVTIDEHQQALSSMALASLKNIDGIDVSDLSDQQLASIGQYSLLYSEALDLDGDGNISVEELSTINGYADIYEGTTDDPKRFAGNTEEENNPKGTITPLSRDAIDEYITGLDCGEDSQMVRFANGEKMSDADMAELGKFLAWERSSYSGIAEDMGIDLSKKSSYLDVFAEE